MSMEEIREGRGGVQYEYIAGAYQSQQQYQYQH